MNNFSKFLNEAVNANDILTVQELDQYIKDVNRIVPNIVKNTLYLIQKYMILDPNDLDSIIYTSKGGLKNISSKLNIPIDELEDLKKMLKDMKSNIKLLPHYLSSQERKSFAKGKIKMEDLTIDLSTQQGRNDIVKMYMPLAYKIINEYVGKSKLTRQDLISSAMLAFANAMNEWNKEKNSTFKTYLSYRIQQQILNDMDKHGHTLSGTNWYATKKYGAEMLDAVSIDGMKRNDDGEFKQDRLASLGFEDDDPTIDRDEEKQWKQLFSIIERKFKQRDIDIFYRYFGLNGYKKEKSKDIAKSYGMSEGNIRNAVINKVLAFLKKDKDASELLSNLQSVYNESMMIDLFGADKDSIIEHLLNDDVFILLEELNKWNNKDVFNRALTNALNNIKDFEVIEDILNRDFEYLDSVFKKNKKTIISFLFNMYPTENMDRKSDVSLLEYMEELQEVYKKYHK